MLTLSDLYGVILYDYILIYVYLIALQIFKNIFATFILKCKLYKTQTLIIFINT